MEDNGADGLVIWHDDFELGYSRIDELTVVDLSYEKITVVDGFGIEVVLPLPYSIDDVDKAEREQIRGDYHNCAHPRSEVRSKSTSNGREMVRSQCLDCGKATTTALKKDMWPEDRGQWDDDLSNRAWAEVSHKLGRLDLRRAAKWQQIQRDRSSEYAEYLRSDEWLARRQLVMERDAFKCQGCLKRHATQVHHKNYDSIYDELLFDLVSVCDDCHRKIHPDKG
jgi:5-methylcytosine-specific restriction endonuclease McrA